MHALNDPLSEFLFSNSGNTAPRKGLQLGWLTLALGGLAAIVGTAKQADAGFCFGVPVGTCQTICLPRTYCNPQENYDAWVNVCHDVEGSHCKQTDLWCSC